jgi:hypothetical protein
MKKFKKKRDKVEAVQMPMLGEQSSAETVNWLHEMDVAWEQEADGSIVFYNNSASEDDRIVIANPGSWIVKTSDGNYEIYDSETFVELFKPCKNKL